MVLNLTEAAGTSYWRDQGVGCGEGPWVFYRQRDVKTPDARIPTLAEIKWVFFVTYG